MNLPSAVKDRGHVTTRSVIKGKSRLVSAKGPRWFVPICSSKSSIVRKAGAIMMPALLISTSRSPVHSLGEGPHRLQVGQVQFADLVGAEEVLGGGATFVDVADGEDDPAP